MTDKMETRTVQITLSVPMYRWPGEPWQTSERWPQLGRQAEEIAQQTLQNEATYEAD